MRAASHKHLSLLQGHSGLGLGNSIHGNSCCSRPVNTLQTGKITELLFHRSVILRDIYKYQIEWFSKPVGMTEELIKSALV